MKTSLYISLKRSILLLIIFQFLNEIFIETSKTQMKFSALDMLEVSTSDKSSEKSTEATQIKLKNKSKLKLKVLEHKFNNFTKDLENVITNLQFNRKIIEDAISGLDKTPVGSPNEKTLLDVIETNKVNLINEKNNLKKMIADFIKFNNEKINYPNFKETLESSAYSLSTGQLSKLSSMILPKLSDDDYFLNTKDSLVFSYLMNENDTQKRIESIGINITIPNQANNTNSSEPDANNRLGVEDSFQRIIQIPTKNSSLTNKTKTNATKIKYIIKEKIKIIKIKNKTNEKVGDCNKTKSTEESEKPKNIPPEILECLKKDVEKEKSKLNQDSNKTDSNSESSSSTTYLESNKNIVIINKNCGSSAKSNESDNNPDSLADVWSPKKPNLDLSKHKLSDAMLNILNADIVKNKGVRLEGECERSNSTRVQKLQSMESLFDLKIDDDENEQNSNSCNKTKYNITIIYVPEKLNITCNETVTPPPKPECSNKTDPCVGAACAQDVLKKLFLKEMLETKKLKHKLIKLYLERKKLKLQREEKTKLFEESNRNKPPLFNFSDFEKVKRIMNHDPTFIEKRYEDAPIRNLRKAPEQNLHYPKKKLNFLKPKQTAKARENNNFFGEYQNNFLESRSNLKNTKQEIYTNGIVEADDVNEISKLNFNEFDLDSEDDQSDNAAKIPIRFLERVDFPHYGYLGENPLLE